MSFMCMPQYSTTRVGKGLAPTEDEHRPLVVLYTKMHNHSMYFAELYNLSSPVVIQVCGYDCHL